MNLCYIEDCVGGIICYESEKSYFLSVDESSKLCFEGTKEELEDYLGHEVTENNIFYKDRSFK